MSGNFAQAFRGKDQSPQRNDAPPGTGVAGAPAPGRAPQQRTTYEYSPSDDEHPLANFVLGTLFFLCASAFLYVLARFPRLLWICDNYGQQPFPFSLIAGFYRLLLLGIFECMGLLWRAIKLLWNVSVTGYPKVDFILSIVLILGFLRLLGFLVVQPVARLFERDDRGWMLVLGLGALVLIPGLLGWILTMVGWLFSA